MGPTVHLPKVTSLEDLSALAVILERRAAERFELMAEAMAARGRADLSELFTRLAREESHHEAALRKAAPALDDSLLEGRWPAELGDAPRPPDAGQLARTSVYQCLAEAVRNEDKAFRFFSYLAANTKDAALEARAEALAKEELAHAALLRRARRTAYHTEKRSIDGWPEPRRVHSLDELRRAALPRELALGRRVEALPLESASAAALVRIGARIRELLAPEPAGDADRLLASSGSPEDDCAAAFEFYDLVASGARDEAVLLSAQELSTLALERIKLLADRDDVPTGL